MCLNLKEIEPPDNKERWLITGEIRTTKARGKNAGKRKEERGMDKKGQKPTIVTPHGFRTRAPLESNEN